VADAWCLVWSIVNRRHRRLSEYGVELLRASTKNEKARLGEGE
jgi:hypothetical protein